MFSNSKKHEDQLLKNATADTEFALEESVQETTAKSRNSEVKQNQPTYEPDKPF
jgi:hypothetical protein